MNARLQSLLEFASDSLRDWSGAGADTAVAAPGRVNLIGEHTDYNDGFVLPMAIDRYVVIACRRNDSPGVAHVHSTAHRESAAIDLRNLGGHDRNWTSYLRGVVAGFLALGASLPPFDAVVHGDVPMGAGLASSAALEIAFATLLESLSGVELEPLQKAKLCQRAEHEFAGVPCGIMDQCVSVMAQPDSAMLLDCRSLQTTNVPLADPNVAALVVNSNVKHSLVESEYGARRRQCEEAARAFGIASLRDLSLDRLVAERERLSPSTSRRARHVVTENERTLAAAAAIRQGDWSRIGNLFLESHASLRDDFEVSCPELDLLVDLLNESGPGVLGCRMTGGGFGGCVVALILRDAAKDVAERVASSYRVKTGREATAFTSRPVGGAFVPQGGKR